MEDSRFLAGLNVQAILQAFDRAPGKENESGKLDSPESSALLAANTFGYFLGRPEELPDLPGDLPHDLPATSLALERTVRFPWRGGKHPCLDVVVETPRLIIGIESKRYEPYRDDHQVDFSKAYWRPGSWGPSMRGYERVRDQLNDGSLKFAYLDATQLVKHAFGLRTAANTCSPKKRPILLYLYAEPTRRADGSAISEERRARHLLEIEAFSHLVAGDEVMFVAASYRALLSLWDACPNAHLRAHAIAVRNRFDV